MRVHKFPTLSPIFLSIFILAICLFGISAPNVQAATFTVMNANDGGAGSLRDAIDQANANGQADTINFDETIFGSHQTIHLNDGFVIVADGKLTINGPTVGVTLSLANSALSLRRAFGLFDANAELEISNLTLTGGQTFQGGGIYSVGTVTVINSIITNNSTTQGGGGIGNAGTLTLNDTTISGNTASWDGGGISNDGGSMTLTNTTVSGNTAGVGGGISNNVGSMTLTNTTVSGNTASESINSVGGGISNGGWMTLTNTTVSGNTASGGGGINNSNGGSMTLTNTTVSGNTARVLGGGIYGDSDMMTLTNTTVSGNTASFEGGGIYSYGEVHAGNSIFADNSAPTAPDFSGFVFTQGYNLFETVPSSGGNLSTDLIGDPKLGPLQDNGGPTMTHALLPGSPAINAGSNPLNLLTDQRGPGFARTVGFRSDIGAYELQSGPACAGVSFAAANNLAVGVSPLSVTTGDFNGDGKIDLATANTSNNNISVLLGNGDGTFAPAVNFNIGTISGNQGGPSGPNTVVTGDFNGDGKIDLVTANESNGGSVSVLTGNGDGTFAAGFFFGAPGPKTVTTGDFNGDGRTDLVTGSANTTNISVLLGNGDGTFAPFVDYLTGAGPVSVTTGDFNGDGKIDLATANSNSHSVSVLTGNGDGTFAAPVNYLAGGGPHSVTTGDFNGDGRTDLATGNDSGQLLVLLGNGDGTFAEPDLVFEFGENVRLTVTTGDFNGDGKIDLATANTIFGGFTGNISVLLGNGDGTFAAAVNYQVGDQPTSVTTGDFNGDGKTDLAATHLNFYPRPPSSKVLVLLNSCSANTAPTVSATPSTQNVQYSDAIADVTVTATDSESDEEDLTIEYSYAKDGGASTAGLPSGLSSIDNGVVSAERRWKVSGTAGVAAGTYAVTVTVSDDAAPALTATATFTIVVARENAVAAPRLSNPVAMQVASAGGSATGVTGQICFDITEVVDVSAGDTSLINAATVQVNVVNGGSVASITPSPVTFSGGGVGGTRTACFTLTLAGTFPNVFEVTLNIGGDYYTGSGTTAFLVFDPSAGFASGGGWIINPNTGYRANYGVNVKYLKNGNTQGSILYIEHRPDGDYKFKSTSLNSSGGFAIVPVTGGGSEARIAGKGNYGVNDVFTGNYSFIARVIDNLPVANDSFGLKLIAPNGQVMNEFTFDPQPLGGGNNQVPKK